MVSHWGDAVGHLHWGWDRWWRRGGWRAADPPNSPQHLVWEDVAKTLPRPPDEVFAVVRDPVMRLVSEHQWQRHRRSGTVLGRALAFLPFSLWLGLMLEAARLHPHVFDNHLRPQSDFVPRGARLFRLEDGLEPVATWLKKTAGAPDAGDVFPHALPARTRPSVAACCKSMIARAHAIDYARFGYPCPPPDIAPPMGARLIAAGLAPVVVLLYRRGWL